MSTLDDPNNGSGRPGEIPRRHPELTEEQEVSARFAAQMMGGELASGPPPADGILAWMANHPGFTRDDFRAEFTRRGVDFDTYWVPGAATDEDIRRIAGTEE